MTALVEYLITKLVQIWKSSQVVVWYVVMYYDVVMCINNFNLENRMADYSLRIAIAHFMSQCSVRFGK